MVATVLGLLSQTSPFRLFIDLLIVLVKHDADMEQVRSPGFNVLGSEDDCALR